MSRQPGQAQGGHRTRREVLSGAALAGAAGVLAVPLLQGDAEGAAPVRLCRPAPEGIETGALVAAPGGRRLWSTDTRASTITAHSARTLERRSSIDVGGAPLGLAIARQGALAVVTTAAYDRPGLAIVDLVERTADRVDVGPDPGAVALSPDGHTAWVTGRGSGDLTAVDTRTGRLRVPIGVGSDPRGLALDPAGRFAVVALNGEAAVAVVDLAHGRVVRRIATALFPAQPAISPDGRQALLTHNGFGARVVSLIDLRRQRVIRRLGVGADPAGVTFSQTGRTALITCAGAGTVTVLDARTGHRRRTVQPGGSPRGVAVAGPRAFVVDGLQGTLTAIRLGVDA